MPGKRNKKKRLLLTAIICGACFFCMGLGQSEDIETTVPESSYEQFNGRIYDDERLEPKDMAALIKQWQGKTGQDKLKIIHQPGWRYVIEGGQYGFRYYISRGTYVLGWQYLERDGFSDWYYFDEETGLLVNNTILDGVVLSKSGYAVAVTAKTEETLELINECKHCDEALIVGTVYTEDGITLTKDVLLVTKKEQEAYIRSKNDKENPMSQRYAVVKIHKNADVTLGAGVQVHTDGNARNGIVVADSGHLSCYGYVGDDKSEDTKYGIAVMGKNSSVTVYSTAQISGAETGLYSEGDTVLTDVYNAERQIAIIPGLKVHAATVSSGKMISGNSNHGITQNGGTLTMKGGTIFNNGTLGSAQKIGSDGGGVYLKNKAVMNMSGGTISGNRASYGAGIYVSSGCRLNLTGGTIGGTKTYDSKATNTIANGNYAREHRMYAGGKKYARGSGGGIYSEGIVDINGKNTVNISYNVSKGPGGGGGILIYSGKLYITGNVNVNYNKTWHSDGQSSSQVASGDPNGEGAGIRVGYDVVKDGAKCLINCSDKSGYPVTSGTVNVKNNQASGDGGGIYVSQGENISLIIKGKTYIQNNVSQESGGGGVKTLGGDLWIYDAVISGNMAKNGIGGGVHSAGTTYLSGCKIYENTAEQEGGGVSFYTSSVGTTGTGTINRCNIYKNTSATGGAGVEVKNTATALIKNGTRVYDNCSSRWGVHCAKDAQLTMEGCYVYGNGSYGVCNQGKTTINGPTRIGYTYYVSDEDYVAAENGGGIYNEGSFAVNKGKELKVYCGSETGFYNKGHADFYDTSTSSFIAAGATQAIKNIGTLIAVGRNAEMGPVVFVAGKQTTYGVNNDGGNLKWSGMVTGAYDVTISGIKQSSISGNIKTGMLNCNRGEIITYGVSQITACETALCNEGFSVAKVAGTIKDNVSYGIQNHGDLYLGTIGNATINISDNVGIFNTGCLFGNEDANYHCFVTGDGIGVQNQGIGYFGTAMEITSAAKQNRTGVLNEERAQLFITGGCYKNSANYGIICKTGSQLYMGEAACVDVSNDIFLDQGCFINIIEPLSGSGVIGRIDTDKDIDRGPGRIVVKVSYAGGTGKKELYHSDGSQKFQLAYSQVEGMTPAFLADGSRIDTMESVPITERDIYVSTRYPITYNSGYEQINGADAEDVSVSQVPLTKYWMEDLVLDLQPPTLVDQRFVDAGWKYLYWEGDNNFIYSRTTELFTQNRPLVLTARWKQEKESSLDAWLYNRSSWLRNQMEGSKSDDQYKYFLAGDTGVITFSCVNLETVSVVWPFTGSTEELKYYDKTGNDVVNRQYQIAELAEDISRTYENSSYQFRIPIGTPGGNYYVTVIGQDENGQKWTVTLTVTVGDKTIASTIRTRIR